MLTLITLLLLAACGEPDTNPNTDDTGTGDGGTAYDGGTEDGGTDTGTEPVGGNCGGPEPPPDESEWWMWICENADTNADYEGYTWPAAGPPVDFENCLTEGGWQYWIEDDSGNSVTLTREDGWVLTCELSE